MTILLDLLLSALSDAALLLVALLVLNFTGLMPSLDKILIDGFH
jgi:hypothetical protein